MPEQHAPNVVTTTENRYAFRVLALYKFVSPRIEPTELPALQSQVEAICRHANARGNILVAPEGINGTICYPCSLNGDDDDNTNGRRDNDNDKNGILWFFNNHERFGGGLRTRVSHCHKQIFHRMKVKLKKEIVTIGNATHSNNKHLLHNDVDTDIEPTTIDPTKVVGTYVAPGPEWDALLSDPNVLVVDVRNNYEVELGTFEHATNPNTLHFREFPLWMETQAAAMVASPNTNQHRPPSSSSLLLVPTKDVSGDTAASGKERTVVPPPNNQPVKAVAMFCTGGIRCEKATSLAIAKNLWGNDIPIYHLEGGVLAYLDTVSATESKFHGECYVFDQRVAVGHGLEPTRTYESCFACRLPLSIEDKSRLDYVPGVSCKHCRKDVTEKKRTRLEERQKQVELATQRGTVHIHDPKEKGHTAA